MKLSRATGYALQLLVLLARQPDGRGATLTALAVPRGLPVSFLANVSAALVRAGILESWTGGGGGSSLARRAEDVTLLDVIEAVDGPLTFRAVGPVWLNRELLDEDLEARLAAICADLAELVRREWGAVTLADLAWPESKRRRGRP
jgi:Rrf2 family protein